MYSFHPWRWEGQQIFPQKGKKMAAHDSQSWLTAHLSGMGESRKLSCTLKVSSNLIGWARKKAGGHVTWTIVKSHGVCLPCVLRTNRENGCNFLSTEWNCISNFLTQKFGKCWLIAACGEKPAAHTWPQISLVFGSGNIKQNILQLLNKVYHPSAKDHPDFHSEGDKRRLKSKSLLLIFNYSSGFHSQNWQIRCKTTNSSGGIGRIKLLAL